MNASTVAENIPDTASGSSGNPLLNPDPMPVSIQGLHKQVIFMDPRRIKPLPKQPRASDSPGFTVESLTSLGESIKAAGQMQAAKVCVSTNPDFDAQLIDGERRLLACTLADIMLKCEVDETLDDTMKEKLLFMSIVSNFGRENHTSLEIAFSCHRLVEEMKMHVRDIAKGLGHPTSWVYMHLGLLKLEPEVQALLVAPADSGDTGGRKRETKLSRPIASMLIGFDRGDQLLLASEVVNNRMSDAEARRYILNKKRDKGLLTRSSIRPGEQFDSLARLVARSSHLFGVYLDMTPKEVAAIMVSQSGARKKHLAEQLEFLSSCMKDVSELIRTH